MLRLRTGSIRWIFAIAGLVALAPPGVNAAYLETPFAGQLFVEFVGANNGLLYLEFGLGTPSITSQQSERQVAIEMTKRSGGGVPTATPAVYAGDFYPAGSALDFYLYSNHLNVKRWVFSSSLVGTPSDAERAAFLDTDDSLGLGGSAIEALGPGDWILHLDDPISFLVDDDDDDFVVRVYVEPVPLPGAAFLCASGLVGLACRGGRHARRQDRVMGSA
ncbi:MAG: hypothetical protein KDC48_18470 [Planctomycetes bacterium]|nr:hypothetical protein [Planctomycetota bacterium]